MSVEAIDRVLTEWDERLRRVDESLLALENEPTYQMLAPRSRTRAPLEGESKRIVMPALDALQELFEHRGRLTEVLDRAKELRESMSPLAFWGNDEKEREIQALLYGPSIELPQEMTPLARRALLDPGARDVRVVPEQLLAAMATAFERARDAVVAVQRAWEHVEPSLEAMARRIADARAAAEALGVEPGVRDELATVERDLEAMRIRVAHDPLGTSSDVESRLAPRIAAVSARLAELAALRDRVAAAAAQARAMLAELRATHARALLAVARLPREVHGAIAPGAPSDSGRIDGLAPWLEKIEEAGRAGRWAAAEIGLGKWREAAQVQLANDSKIAQALDHVLGRRDELVGRLSARRAQAAALAARGVVLGADAEKAARDASQLLAERPTRLARATEAVERYERLVRARAS
jgi:hypothetical protein